MMPARLQDGRYLSRAEKLSVRCAFHTALAKLSAVDVYWLGAARRLVVRSVTVRRRAIPADGYYLGRFFYPFSASLFVRELDELLADRSED